ncbi:MAG: alpha-L-arabinofuranosidase [Clostridiales bacterium]|jgi:alpha-N-arabinofuranosidase|nr:alpha-L-arabinofuranosidase [Clostridiales bacterium]
MVIKMAKTAKVTLHPDYKIGEVDKRLYGSFLEPIGSWVYGGIYNPRHPTADDLGFRRDIIDGIREFGLPILRFPGGNFISGWDWKGSIGPKDQRKAQLDLAWFQYEPNQVGHDEYIEWCKRIGAEPMYTINVDSEDLKSAFNLVEYCNHPGGTYWSDLRKKYGHADPYGIKLWCLGNEPDGTWQIASWEKDPRGYGIRAHELSKIIKWTDGKSETVVAGSSSPHNETYPSWDMEVLEQCYDTVDYVSIHHYHSALPGDTANYLNSTGIIEEFINTTVAACDYMQAKKHSPKKLMISFDEYGCNFREQREYFFGRGQRRPGSQAYDLTPGPHHDFKHMDPANYVDRFAGRQQYQMLNALSTASVLLLFLRRADRVKIGVMTGGMRGALAYDGQHVWKNAAYYPYYQMNQYGRGVSILPVVDGPTFNTEQFNLDGFNQYHAYEGVQSVDVAAVHNEEKDELNIFIVNRDQEDDIEVTLDVRGFEGYKLAEHIEMYTDDLKKANTFENPDAIRPTVNSTTKIDGGRITAFTKQFSWNVIRLAKK